MKTAALDDWLDAWGYLQDAGNLHRPDKISRNHPYAREIQDLLDPDGDIQARAVFDVGGVPTVCFLAKDRRTDKAAILNGIRERIWNQSLISIVLVVDWDTACALPVSTPAVEAVVLTRQEAGVLTPFSSADVQSGTVFADRPEWFSTENRVDQVLLRSLKVMVDVLQKQGLTKTDAQLLMAQVMFVSYLEHRGIIGDQYRSDHQVGQLSALVESKNLAGIIKLLRQLKKDFNGDLLEPGERLDQFWSSLVPATFESLLGFLRRDDLESGQRSLWHYDFRFIPVELISGIYESFLSENKREVGAFYTPRHLAMLAVDLAFQDSTDLLNESIYDGACGSGILLTTAFRRLIGHAQGRRGGPLSFSERVELLERSIFGSDLNLSACRVTAFSLYLSVLEGLAPADLAALAAEGKAKLPRLVGKNLRGGEIDGDFFDKSNPRASRPSCTIFLSNPPWVEPPKTVNLSSDTWACTNGVDLPRRQTAAAFVFRAKDCLVPTGRVCFILPVSLLAAPSSKTFVRDLLARYRVEKLINFGDIRKLLFFSARQPTLVMVATSRPADQFTPARNEKIDYWAPKADVSLAFGRLTIHDADRSDIRAQSLSYSNELLTTLFWGNSHDVAMIGQQRLKGTLGVLLKREDWSSMKGFHVQDSSVEKPVSSAPLAGLDFLDAKSFSSFGSILTPETIKPFPSEKWPTVARISLAMLKACQVPKVVFTDGMDPDRRVCAAYSSARFCFTSSMGVLTAPASEAKLLRFIAFYLQSDLARYFLLMTAYQVAFERERVSLSDLKALPFVAPDKHRDPKHATAIIEKLAYLLSAIEAMPSILHENLYAGKRQEAESLLADYFELTPLQCARIQEISSLVINSVQPGTISGLNTALHRRPTKEEVRQYGVTLCYELREWQKASGGIGSVESELVFNASGARGPIGVVRMTPSADARSQVETAESNLAVKALLDELRDNDLLPASWGESLYVMGDIIIRHGNSIYLLKPFISRFWMTGSAQRDAERIVRYARGMENK
ncbi:HsdM family class I SAM-dependent methyltransferase [Castellaniella sp.]|uniref:HsdM family class I SAM-dependent methyltransferase n=1 Tax=Castellaniella sp. TaxID=1955812 RepID=UPI002AFF6ED2|nr:N-6 DNA methylase [Castellaniella sp.]